VPALEGTLTGPPWRVFCDGCLDEDEPNPRVLASVTAGKLCLRLDGYLGGSLFSRYRESIAGARFNRADTSNRAPLSLAPRILAAVGEIDGLDLVVDEAVTAALEERTQAAVAEQSAVAGRLEAIEAELATRGKSLYPYQRMGVPWLAGMTQALLADDMGLGKTLQALLAAPADSPIVVIAPAVAKGVWTREVAKWRPDLTATPLKGRKSFRWAEAGELVVTNYEILPGKVSGKTADLGDLPEPPAGTVLVFDEAHRIKTPKAAMTKKARQLAKRVRAAGGRVWLLTATPLLNKPPDLWALLVAAGVETQVYPKFAAFAEAMGGEQEWIRVRGGGNMKVWKWGRYSPDATVADRLRPVMLRRMKTEVLEDLPAKRYEDLNVNGLDRKTKKLCDEALAKLEEFDLDEMARVADSLPTFEGLSATRAALAASKIKAVEALVEDYEEADEPLVVFSAHRAPVEAIGAREGWATITGETPAARRTEIEERFQRGELRGVAATIQAGGVAITLTRASHAIFVDLDWTPSLNSQAEDRIYRIGQERGVLIRRLVADHALDQHVTKLLAAKQALLDGSVNAARRAGDDDAAAEALEEAQELLSAVAEAALSAAEDNSSSYEDMLAAVIVLAEAREAEAAEAKFQGDMKERAERRGVDVGSLAGGKNGTPPPRRGPNGAAEEWAAEGLQALAALDPDRAFAKNDAGFNRADGFLGHMLAMRLRCGGLSEIEWKLALGMLPKYHRQIGERPEEVA
jgi:hypothetical protein